MKLHYSVCAGILARNVLPNPEIKKATPVGMADLLKKEVRVGRDTGSDNRPNPRL